MITGRRDSEIVAEMDQTREDLKAFRQRQFDAMLDEQIKVLDGLRQRLKMQWLVALAEREQQERENQSATPPQFEGVGKTR